MSTARADASASVTILAGTVSGRSRMRDVHSMAMPRRAAISAAPRSKPSSVSAIAAGSIPRKSTRRSTSPGTMLIMFGRASMKPTVPTMPRPVSRARRSTSSTSSAAAATASRRSAIGVPPA
jgi:hypothetical protein